MSKPHTKTSHDPRKRELLVTCNKCKEKVDSKKTLLCTLCKNHFEYDCIGYSEKLHRLKDTATKKSWRCKTCEQKQKVHSTPNNSGTPIASTTKKSSLPHLNQGPPINDKNKEKPNKDQDIILITDQRNRTEKKCEYKVNVSTNNSFQSLSDDESPCYTLSSSIVRLNSSCPEVGKLNLEEKIEELKKRNKELQEKLQIADNEIDNLLLENSELKKIVSRHEKKANHLADIISHSSSKKNITLRNKNKSLKSTQLDFSINGENKIISQNLDCYNPSSAPSMDTVAKQPLNIDYSGPSSGVAANLQTSELIDVARSPQSAQTSAKPTIYVIGDQQVRGLAEQLVKSRSKGWNDCYNVMGIVKPFALSSEILNSCSSLYNSLKNDDILILSLGCNDENPYFIMSNLCNILNNVKNCKILLLSTYQNCYLNVNKLNGEINALIRNYTNCTFINVELLLADYPLRNMTINQLVSFKINIEIDYETYKINFITNFKKIKNSFSASKNITTSCDPVSYEKYNTLLYKKGTIPYYFRNKRAITQPEQTAGNQSTDFFRSQTP